MMEQFGVGVVIAGWASLLIQWLKGQSWFPFAKFNAFWMNTVVAAVTAFISAGVLTWTFSENGDFLLSGNIYAILQALFLFTQQYLLQHFFYKTLSSPPPTPILTKAAELERDAESKKG